MMHLYSLSVFCITETHLLSSMPSSFIDIPSYSVIRNDVSGNFAKHGVCIFVHNSIKHVSLDVPIKNCVVTHLVDLNLYIVAVYRPPSYSDQENSALVQYLLQVCCDKEVLLVGDFNLPSLSWDQENWTHSVTGVERQFLDAFLSLGLTQWVTEATYPRSGNILDLMFTTDDDRIGSVAVLPPIPGCDHCPTMCDYLFDSLALPASLPSKSQWKWHHGKYNKIARSLAEVDWDLEFLYLDPDDAYMRFLNVVTPLIQEHIPVSSPGTSKRLPWKVNPPSSLLNRKREAWVKYKSVRLRLGRSAAPTREALQDFFTVNQSVKTFALRSQSEYELQMLEKFKCDPKLLHGYVRSKKVGCPTVGPLRLRDGTLTDDPQIMVEELASAFASVYSSDTTPKFDMGLDHQRVESRMYPVNIQVGDVLQVLQSLDPNTAAGLDNIHPMLLKSCARELAYPLYKIFCLSLLEGRLPESWKTSRVTPIFKKGSKYVPLNYRPVCLNSVPCKCLERLITKKLNEYLNEHDILTNEQFGFREGRSTADQMLLVYDSIAKWYDEGSVIDLMLFDFSKAFDVVSHSILLTKLKHLGIEDNLIAWIEAFLVGRTMRVAIRDAYSNPRSVKSGVPQGSVLGPILFLLFVNHIAANLTCQFKIFADDLKLYMNICGPDEANHAESVRKCQSDITTLNQTAISWGLKFNKDKCVVIRFQRKSHIVPPPSYHIDGYKIRLVDSHTDLGVMVDSSLKFHEHIQRTAQKANGLAQNLLKSTACRSPEFMVTLFCTHIRPILEYCSNVWNTGYIGDQRVLESVQRRWTKHIDTVSHLDYDARLKTLDMYSVSGRLLRADMICCWKIFNDKSCIAPDSLFSPAPVGNTRGHPYKVGHVRAQTDVRRRSFSIRCVDQWNRLPANVVLEQNYKSFKQKLAMALGNELYWYP